MTPLLIQRERSVTAPAAQSAPYVPAAGAAPPSTVPPAEAGFADAGAEITLDRDHPTLALVDDALLMDAVVFSGSPALVKA